jgi:hypothetical protein
MLAQTAACAGLGVLLSVWTEISVPQGYLATTPGGLAVVLAVAGQHLLTNMQGALERRAAAALRHVCAVFAQPGSRMGGQRRWNRAGGGVPAAVPLPNANRSVAGNRAISPMLTRPVAVSIKATIGVPCGAGRAVASI